jgi:hypothetical protein
MGIDFQYVAYRGTLGDADLARLLRERVPGATLFRHARSRGTLPHAFALYAPVADRKPPTLPPEISQTAAQADRSLSDVAKSAWKIMRDTQPEVSADEVARTPREARSVAAARALSKLVTQAMWVSIGDHSLTGGFARFAKGKVVEQATPADMWITGDAYREVPAGLWRAAIGAAIGPVEFFVQTFDQDDSPPLREVNDDSRAIAFDPDEHDLDLG